MVARRMPVYKSCSRGAPLGQDNALESPAQFHEGSLTPEAGFTGPSQARHRLRRRWLGGGVSLVLLCEGWAPDSASVTPERRPCAVWTLLQWARGQAGCAPGRPRAPSPGHRVSSQDNWWSRGPCPRHGPCQPALWCPHLGPCRKKRQGLGEGRGPCHPAPMIGPWGLAFRRLKQAQNCLKPEEVPPLVPLPGPQTPHLYEVRDPRISVPTFQGWEGATWG